MQASRFADGVEKRFSAMVEVLGSRLIPTHIALWEDTRPEMPWSLVDRLAHVEDDAEAIGWALSDASVAELSAIVMGYRALIDRLHRDDAHAIEVAEAAMASRSVAQSLRVFVAYAFGLPLNCFDAGAIGGCRCVSADRP